VHGWPRVPGNHNNGTVYYVLVVMMIVFGGEKCVGIEGSDSVPWWKGPSANGEGFGPVSHASGRGALLPEN
jgi:hypothetical protein